MNDAIDAVVPRRALLAVLTLAAWPRLPVAAPSASPATIQWSAIELLDGKVLKPADWTDMAAVVVFWSTTCPFCRRHNEHVQKLFAASAGQRLRVLGASLDRDAGAVRRYMADRGYGFPVTLDAARLRPLFTTRAVIPMTCTVDRGGHLRQTIPGEMFEEDVLELGRLAGQPRGA